MPGHRQISLVAVAFVLLVAMQSSARAAVVLFDDDFDHGQYATTNFAGLANWTVTDGTVDAFQDGAFSLPCPSSGCLDMDGSSRNAGTIETKSAFNLGAGDYVLSLNVRGNARNGQPDSMDVFFGATLLGTIMKNSADPYVVEEFAFTLGALTSGSIILDHAGGDNVGILLDRVTLEAVADGGPKSVPEPTTMALLGLSLLGIGAVKKRLS